MAERMNKLVIDNARLIFKNFSGKGDNYNREGDRNFAVIIEATAYRQHPCLSMNALLVLRPAKLWAFNFGHPCPPSKKGEVLLLGQAEPTMVGIEFDRTSIPLAFRRARGLPLPLHRTSQSPQSLQKNNNPFASHHHPCL